MSKCNRGSFLFRSKAELMPCSGFEGHRAELRKVSVHCTPTHLWKPGVAAEFSWSLQVP